MAFGAKASDPNTQYLVYAFAWRGKVFYIGLAQSDGTRHTHRWSFVANLLRHETAGTLVEGKRRELSRHSNAVLAALQRAGLEEHDVHILWEGPGRAAAEVAEATCIREHLARGCVLANIQESFPRTLDEVLAYLSVIDAPAHSFDPLMREVKHVATVADRTSLEDLVRQLRQNAANDVEFAQRVALACISLVETKAEPATAIRVTFRIQ